MSIKGDTQEWYVGKKKSSMIDLWGRRIDFDYSELGEISYCYPDGRKAGKILFIKRSREIIEFKFRQKSCDPVGRAINLIEENNPDLKIRESGLDSGEEGGSDLLGPEERGKGFWSTGRLTIGVISIVLFALISLQSCAAGLKNTFENNGATSGTSGFILSILLLFAGIVGLCTRNSKSKTGPIIATTMYWLGALMTVGTGDTYGDLPIWGVLSFVFGIVFLWAAIKTNVNSRR